MVTRVPPNVVQRLGRRPRVGRGATWREAGRPVRRDRRNGDDRRRRAKSVGRDGRIRARPARVDAPVGRGDASASPARRRAVRRRHR